MTTVYYRAQLVDRNIKVSSTVYIISSWGSGVQSWRIIAHVQVTAAIRGRMHLQMLKFLFCHPDVLYGNQSRLSTFACRTRSQENENLVI